ESVLFGDVEDYILRHVGLEAGVVYGYRVASRRQVRDVETPAVAGGHVANVSAGFGAVNHDGRARHDGAAGIGHRASEGCGQFLSRARGREAENNQGQNYKERKSGSPQILHTR